MKIYKPLFAGFTKAKTASVAWKGRVMKSERICLSWSLSTVRYPPKSTSFTTDVSFSSDVEITCARYQLFSVGAAHMEPSGNDNSA